MRRTGGLGRRGTINSVVTLLTFATPVAAQTDTSGLATFPIGAVFVGVVGVIVVMIVGGGLLRKRQSDIQIAETKRLQDRFAEIENQLSSPEPLTRANALLRLADFAAMPAPGAELGTPRTLTNYPYFLPVVTRLATALSVEPSAAIRAAAREGFKNVIAFASGSGEGQPLLRWIIARLADTNRTARDNFIPLLAEWSVIEGGEAPLFPESNKGDTFHLLVTLAPFCDKSDAPFYDWERNTRAVLESLMIWGEQRIGSKIHKPSIFAAQRERHLRQRQMQTADGEQIPGDTLILPALEIAAQQLIDIRDALADALNAQKMPVGFPAEQMQNLFPPIDEPMDTPLPPLDRQALDAILKRGEWRECYATDLRKCFLAGANMARVQLQGADLGGAQLQGAYLRESQLQGANLREAQLTGTYFYDAQLQGAELGQSQSQRIILWRTQLQGASLSGAQLQEANLGSAQLAGATLWDADLQGASLVGVNLQGAYLDKAQLQGAYITYARLEGACLQDTQLQGASLHYTRLQGADLSGAQINGTVLYGVSIREQADTEGRATILPNNTLEVANFEPGRIRSMRGEEADARTERLKVWLAERATADIKESDK